MRQSLLWTKTLKEAPKDEVSVNAQLLVRGGFVDKVAAGIYSYLPLGYRVLMKIENIIREEMNAIGGLEVLMPALQPKDRWAATGRWDTFEVLFRLKGSGDKEYALGATHEEIVTPLVQRFVASYKDLPVSVYQIQTKFRDEPRAKSGLLRGREFRMKDFYSFHADEKDLDAYYEKMKTAYARVYERCGVGASTYLTFASGGAFSKYSHEFQMVTESGEDIIHLCEPCRVAVNKEIIADQPTCPSCGASDLVPKKAIEVGNIFKLQTTFSEPFDAVFADEGGKEKPMVMGCYGLGPSRLMGAIVEAFHDDKGIIWPTEVAPFAVHLVSLSKEQSVSGMADALYQSLEADGVEVLYDDRPGVRAGEKFAESDLMGIPVRMVISDRSIEKNGVEVKRRNAKDAELAPMDGIKKFLRV